jgi:acetyl-CoA carboxylase beta subunit
VSQQIYSCRSCKLPLHPNNLRAGLDTCAVCRRHERHKARQSIGKQLVREVLADLAEVPHGTIEMDQCPQKYL